MEKTTSADGTVIAVDRYGDGGPAVVLVEGAFCDRRTSTRLATLLAPRFTVYAYDRRGRGDSGDSRPYAVEREIEDLAAVIELAGGSASVYGMSSGAVLGMETAARNLGVARLAMYDAPVIVEPSRREPAAGAPAVLAELIAAGRRGEVAAYFLTKIVEMPAAIVEQMRQAPIWPGLEAIAHTLVYDTTITGDASVLDRAPGVSIPTLAVAGGASPWFLQDGARALAAAIPGARHEILPGQTHDVDYAELAPMLAEFFARVGGRNCEI